MQGLVHHPEVVRSSDGLWAVICPECQRTTAMEGLIGIGTPVQSKHEAQLMRDNHVAKRGSRGRGRVQGSGTPTSASRT
jgi:hypothetical protein